MSGLRRKPPWVRVAAGFLGLVCLGMPLQVMVLYGHPPTEAVAIWAKLAPQNKLVMALAALAALGVQRVARWGWYAAGAFVAAAFWNNWVLLHFPTPMPRWTVAAATACLAAAGAWLLRPSVFRLFHTPESHWWRAARRFRLAAPVELETGDGRRAAGSLVDVSRTGFFAEVGNLEVPAGEVLQVRIRFGGRVLCCAARVVRRARACATYPDGFGLSFTRVPLPDRVWLWRGLPGLAAA